MIEFGKEDTETIELPATTFDAALYRAELMFLPDLNVGLLNIYQSFREGGHFAAAVWASSEKVPIISEVMDLLLFFLYFLTLASLKGSVTNIWSFFLYY